MATVTPPPWKFILCYLDGQQIGEIHSARERKVDLLLKRLPTAAFKVDIDHPVGEEILGVDRLIKAYRGGVLRYNGIITGVEETATDEEQSIAVNTINPGWRLTKRLLGRETVPPYTGTKYGTDEAPLDRSVILTNMLNDTNQASHTGVVVGTTQASSLSGFGRVIMKPVMESISELLASIDSPEAEFVPVEPYLVGANTVLTKINTWYPRMGADKPAAVFEYGTGKYNVASYKRQKDMDGILNRAYSLPEGFPDSKKNVKWAEDITSIASRGRFEEVISADLASGSLRQALVDQHVDIRKAPREIITFVPMTNADVEPFADYYLGDSVRGRAVSRGVLRFDAMFRVYGLSFTIDDKGNETLELELILPQS